MPADSGIGFLAGLFFSFRLFIMLLCVRFFGTEPQAGTGVTLALDAVLLMLVLFQTSGAADRSLKSIFKTPSARWALFFLAFSFASLMWSVAASIFAAGAYWCAMASDVAVIALLLRIGSVQDAAHSIMKGYVWGACAVAIIAWLLPGQSDMRLGDEELLGTNDVGFLCAVAFFFAQYLLLKKAGSFTLAAFLLGITLLRSLSKTTIVAFLVAEGFVLLRDRFMSRKTKLILLSVALLTGVAFSSLLSSYFTLYANTGNSPETLTGRLAIWALFLEEAIKQPWIGHGFYSVWKVIPPFGEFEARHAHNEWVQQFYLFGVTGIVMMIGLYGSFYLQVRRFAAGSLRVFYIALLIFTLIRGLAESEVYDFALPIWAILLLGTLMQHESVVAEYTLAPLDDQHA